MRLVTHIQDVIILLLLENLVFALDLGAQIKVIINNPILHKKFEEIYRVVCLTVLL